MADFKKLSWMRDRLKSNVRVTTEEITPSVGWTENSELHKLLIDLPGFKKGDIKLQVNESGAIAITGGRKVSDTKRVQFRRTVKAPEDADITNYTMKFEGDTLEVSMPKVVKPKEPEPEPEPDSEPEPEIQSRAKSSDLGEENKEESEKSKEAEEKEEPEIQNAALSSDLKEGSQSDKGVKEKEEANSEPLKEEVPSSDLREKIEGPKVEEKQEPEPEPEPELEPEPEPELQKEDPRSDLQEETQGNKAGKEKVKQEIQNAASSSGLKDEHSKEPEAQHKDSNSDIPDHKMEDRKENKEEEGAGNEEEHEKKSKISSSEEQCHHDNENENSRLEDGSQKSVIGKIMEQRAILLASIISFTLGILLSPKFHRHPSK